MGSKDRSKPVACWSEKDMYNGKVVDALVVILRTKGCSWRNKSGCLMCGYSVDSDPDTQDEEIMQQLSFALERSKGEDVLKLYTSGSFFNEAEISNELRQKLLDMIGGKTNKLIIECRPEFISSDKIKEALDSVDNLEVAIGLESANDVVLQKCVNKGFTLNDYINGAREAREAGATVRTYLLIKPPYLTEKEAIEDAVNSAKVVADYSDAISFNPVNVQKGTLVERLWRQRKYRPPWLWSVIEVIERSKGFGTPIICSPSGGGTPRGAHNCGECDKTILKALDEFSIGVRESFDELDCPCKEFWLDILELEGIMHTSADVQRIIQD